MLSKNVRVLDSAANRLYLEAMKEAAPGSYIPSIATVRTTGKRTETSPIMGNAPKMELMQQHDPYLFSPMIDGADSVTMARYGAGVQIHEDDWNDDQLGAFSERVQEMGRESVLLPNELLLTALITGDAALGWDGVPFFSASHPAKQKAPAWSNIVTGTGVTAAQVTADLTSVVARFGTLRLLNGRPANNLVTKLTIVAPWAMRGVILEAINPNQQLVNVAAQRGLMFETIFDPDLDDDDVNDYYVLNTGHPIRALVLWEREAARIVSEQKDSGANFTNDVRRYKSKWRGKVQYGMPQRAMKVTNT